MTQKFLSAFDAGSPEEQPEPSGSCEHLNTVKLSVASPRLLPDNHQWAGKAPVWCDDCNDIVDRVEVQG